MFLDIQARDALQAFGMARNIVLDEIESHYPLLIPLEDFLSLPRDVEQAVRKLGRP